MGSRRLSSESIFSTTTSLGRSRTWSDDIQKHWNLPALSSETTDQRIARYSEYFRIPDEQLRYIYGEFLKELDNIQASEITSRYPNSGPALLDTLVETLPTGREQGVGYAIDFSGAIINVVKSSLNGAHNIQTTSHSINLKRVSSEHKKGLLDANSGAIHLFDTIGLAVKTLLQKCDEKRAFSSLDGDTKDVAKPELPIGFSVAFPFDQVSKTSASIIEWTKEFETGRNTCDPVEGMDLSTLMDMAFWRQELNVKTSHVINDSTALLIAGMYERKLNQPPCVASFIINNGLNGAYLDPRPTSRGYKGCIIDTQIGRLDKSLPVTDIDLEVDFADEGGRSKQIFEKLIGIVYLGECCRRLIVKVWQNNAPALAWARHSLPTHAAAACVSDSTPTLDLVDVYMSGLWGLETDFETRITIQKLFTLVFERSAGLAAAAIVALAKKSGRLTPAMGGVTVAVEPFIKNFPWYEEIIMRRITNLIGDLSEHIKLMPIENGPGKGSCILDVLQRNNQNLTS